MKASIENLKPLIHCPVCDRKYDPSQVLFLEETSDRTTFHLTCVECKVSTFVFVSSGQMGVASFGMLTDVERSEAEHFFGKDPVSSDDVLEVHQFLEANKKAASFFGI